VWCGRLRIVAGHREVRELRAPARTCSCAASGRPTTCRCRS
jgi:hypothetical protein